ncbi:Com family DNA-binding transcriptional regulator [Marinisporobacter balticus]|uniref:Mu-like prophage protein Com n=1 Tax=Marinisporobacter balticus TaxID=2018667 RepID=A0A4R2KBS4_9FIRM|nr:Com family DNA-binding transcriptional regulator [Marinisporobacter balticus]TCO69517.1 Mu-like prophage protein Com [Marinisporobacter balticus]
MTEIRCKKCGRVLCEANGKVKIRCRKCGEWNYIDTDTADQASQGK